MSDPSPPPPLAWPQALTRQSLTPLLWLTATVLLLIAVTAMAGVAPSGWEPVSEPLERLRGQRRLRLVKEQEEELEERKAAYRSGNRKS